jgi:calcineurin-like phosphoesterase family protein
MIYFTSDLHAFHKNIIQFDELPFKDLKEYREHIIKVWNETISSEDEVYLLGDIAVGGTNGEILSFLQRLNGKKYLIQGNHDYRTIMKCKYLTDHFEWVRHYHSFDYNKERIILFHCPIESWPNMTAMKSIHLHGHTHGKSRKVPNRMDIGFKACNFKIYSIEEIIKKIRNE